jgi:hypothetical protein
LQGHFLSKNKEKDIKRTFVRTNLYVHKAIFNKKISGTSTGINSIINYYYMNYNEYYAKSITEPEVSGRSKPIQ